jgi:penicillin-binding protein 2
LAGDPVRPAPALDIAPEHLEFVRRAMGGVVEHGTAAASKLPIESVKMAGKTGTAQVRRITMAERAGGVIANESLAWRMRDHSLFVGFAPVENPRYAAAAIIEHGGFGAQVAAPLVRDTMLYLFDKQKALAALAAYEESIGGGPDERAVRKTNAWRAANGLPPLSQPQA